jgi:hypothetical protein
MAYYDIAQMAVNYALQSRITACAATQDLDSPHDWMGEHIWAVVAAPGWGDSWASAIAGGMSQDEAGANPGVITDGMILSEVQAINGPLSRDMPPTGPVDAPPVIDNTLPTAEPKSEDGV